ncbi:unnamed protein product, partial [marine sediment metagenome]
AEIEIGYKNKVKKKDRIKIVDSSSVYNVLKDVWS